MVRLYKKVVGLLAVMLVVLNFASVLPAVTVAPSLASVSFVSVAYADDENGKWDPKVQDKTTPDGKINLGQTGVFKSLEEQFEKIATNGVKKLRPHIITLICLLGMISFCTNWSLYEGQMRLSMIIGTIMKIGFFFWLAMVWTDVADAIFTSLQNIGLVAANAGVDDNFTSKINGSTIVDRGFVACSALWSSLKITSPIISLIKLGGIVLILFSHFWIAFEVFITRVEFRIFECLAFVFLPFGVFQATSFLFQKCVSGVFGYGAKLMVMTFLVGVCESQINWQSEAGMDSPFALTEKSTYGDCLVVGLSLLLMAFLVSKAGELASGIVSGQPSMSGKGVVGAMKSAAKTVAGGAAMVAGATMIANAMEKGGAEAASSVGDAVGQAAGQSDSKAGSPSGEKLPSGPATESGGSGGGFGLAPSPAPAAKAPGGASQAGTSGAPGGASQVGTPGASGGAPQAGAPGAPGGTPQTGAPGASGGTSQAGSPGAPGGTPQAGAPGTPGGASQTGAPGTPGVASQTGASGIPGSASQAGASGIPGSASQAGASGIPGTPGSASQAGAQGAQGTSDGGKSGGDDAKKAAGADADSQGGYATKAWNFMNDKVSGMKDTANEFGKKVSDAGNKAGGIASDALRGVSDDVKNTAAGKRAAATLHKVNESMKNTRQAASEAVDRPALQSLDKAADGLVTAYKADNLKETVSGLKQAAGGTAAAAAHGATKLGGAVLDGAGRVLDSRGARVAKRTAGILARAALMRNPITSVFYGEMNKFRNDYVRMEQFKKDKETGQRQILHPDSKDQWLNQND